MSSLFLSKTNTRTTTLDELIDVAVKNKDLLQKSGCTNINGIVYYHIKSTQNGDVVLSYGSNSIRISNQGSHRRKEYRVQIDACSTVRPNEHLDFLFRTDEETVAMKDKSGSYQSVPFSAFESETDFFQYTLLNFRQSCTDLNLIKLVKLIQGVVINE